jgi:hypothetical protein
VKTSNHKRVVEPFPGVARNHVFDVLALPEFQVPMSAQPSFGGCCFVVKSQFVRQISCVSEDVSSQTHKATLPPLFFGCW